MAAHTLVVRLTGPDAAIREFLSEHPAEPSKVGVEGDVVSVQIEISADLVPELGHRHIAHEVLYDATERGRQRLAEVGHERFSPGRPPHGLGKKLR